MSVPKIVDVSRDDCARNISEGNSTMCQSLICAKIACTPSLFPRVITWLEPVTQSKTQYLVSGQQKHTTSMSSWSADTLFWQLSINYNMDVQYQRCTYGNGATLLFFKVWGIGAWHMDVRTDSCVTTKISEIDGLPNFVRYGAPLAWIWHAGAQLFNHWGYEWVKLQGRCVCVCVRGGGGGGGGCPEKDKSRHFLPCLKKNNKQKKKTLWTN